MTHVNIVHHTGHHKVINRNDKTFIIEINGKSTIVSIDRIKLAYMLSDSLSSSPALVIPPDSNDDRMIPSKTTYHYSQQDMHIFPKDLSLSCNFMFYFY